MSRVGKKPIVIPSGVEVKMDGAHVGVKGANGEMSYELPAMIRAKIEGEQILVDRENDDKSARSLHGTARSVIANMLEGVHKGYSRDLEIQGVGYRAQMQGRKLVLNVGYSHPIEFEAPEGINIVVADNTKLSVSGASKQMVGQVSARIRAFAPAEPYKGKGIRYRDEHVRRKAGKTVA